MVVTFKPPPVEPETARFHELFVHFKGADVCGQCATYYAILSVEKEAHRPVALEPPLCTGQDCMLKVRASWTARPRRQAA